MNQESSRKMDVQHAAAIALQAKQDRTDMDRAENEGMSADAQPSPMGDIRGVKSGGQGKVSSYNWRRNAGGTSAAHKTPRRMT